MLNKKLVIVVIAIIAFIGLIIITKAVSSKGKGNKPAVTAAQAKKDLGKAPVKKMISKGRGALTVKILNSKRVEVPVRLKAFKSVDKSSSIYMASFVAGRMQELTPGDYDIEIDLVPQRIYKGIRVSEGKETVQDLGCLTGALYIKTVNSKKAVAPYPIRVLYPKSGEMVMAFMTNKSMDVAPGVYDIEIGTSPRIIKNNVKVESGKENIMDLGCVTGSLKVKTIGEEGKDVRQSVRLMKAGTGELVSSSLSNKPIELAAGKYDLDVLSNPKQSKKDVIINAGEESMIEFTVKTPIAPQKVPAAPKRLAPLAVAKQ